jgi:anti-sigma factor RsiW
MSTNIPDDVVIAYVNDELEGAERARVEQAIARDAILAQRVAQQRALRERQRGALSGALNESLARRLMHARKLSAPSGPAQVIDLARARAARARRTEPRRVPITRRGTIAASLGIGLCVGLLIEYLFSGSAPTEYRDGALLARGALERALNQELSSAAPPAGAARIGLSFRSRSGAYCRTFELEGSHALTGLACREQAQWRIAAAVAVDANRSPASTQPRRAASVALPAPLQQAVNERISGEPLDAAAETLARNKGWH